MDSTRLALDYQWVPVESEPGIPYSFGSIDGEITAHMKREHNCPAVYRWNIQAGDHTVYYVGETDLLTRRLRNYLRGHKSQPTASRLNKELQERTEKGQKAILEVLSFTPFSIGGQSFGMGDLMDKHFRRFLEAWLTMYHLSCGHELLNK